MSHMEDVMKGMSGAAPVAPASIGRQTKAPAGESRGPAASALQQGERAVSLG